MNERRELEFSDLDEITKDIEQLASVGHQTLGQQSFARIVKHLATTNEMMVGNISPPKLPWYMRMMMPLMRSKILNGPVNPGFKLPSNEMQEFFWGKGEIALDVAIKDWKASVEQYRTKGPLPSHPIFGKASQEEMNSMMLKHAAMHMSFVVPEQG